MIRAGLKLKACGLQVQRSRLYNPRQPRSKVGENPGNEVESMEAFLSGDETPLREGVATGTNADSPIPDYPLSIHKLNILTKVPLNIPDP